MKVTEIVQAPRFSPIVMPRNENHILCVLQMQDKKEVIFIIFFDGCCCCGGCAYVCAYGVCVLMEVFMCVSMHVHVCAQARGQHQVSDFVIV